MELNKAFGQALKRSRMTAGLTQEDFSTVSSRTYLSALERGLQSPTLEKLAAICELLGAHPVTLVAATYLAKEDMSVEELLRTLTEELGTMGFLPPEPR
ncbi:helix-turn-helix transcriptional regulator [Pseudomonas sp. KB-10]|uniref:helix-turn-helix domain-containing protein n=1 Tax=Pseudomonas sp. KB-10 TaxID=2292264 RepID=UPI001BAF7AD2|nr:helix-turn-helix transcriptional regulator [Pseudomonas sp. KB-10]